MADEKYLYEVHPVRPVISPIEGRLVRRPFSCELTISQLGEIMGKARVFRRFPDLTELVPVTGATVHELHRARFSDPTPEVAFKEKERANVKLVEVNKNEPATASVVEDHKEEEVKSLVVEEKPVVVEEPTEDMIDPEPENVDEASVEKTEETAEIATSEEVSVEEQGKQENNTDLEAEASQDAEKEVSESKAITTIVIPSQDNANKFHDKKKDKKHNKEN